MSLIRIINPIGPHSHIGRKHADRYVRRGDAKYVGDALFFLRRESDKRTRAVQRTLLPFAPGGMATVEQVQNLPCAGPAIRIFYEGKERWTPRGLPSGPVYRPAA